MNVETIMVKILITVTIVIVIYFLLDAFIVEVYKNGLGPTVLKIKNKFNASLKQAGKKISLLFNKLGG